MGEGCRILGIDFWKVQMTGHDSVQLGHERGIGEKVAGEEFLDSDIGDWEVVMWIAQGEPVGGEMFSAGENSLLAHPSVEDACFVDDVLRVVSPTATSESVVLFWEMIEVEDGGKVEIDPEEFEELSGEGSKAGDLFGCGFFRKGGRVWLLCAICLDASN